MIAYATCLFEKFQIPINIVSGINSLNSVKNLAAALRRRSFTTKAPELPSNRYYSTVYLQHPSLPSRSNLSHDVAATPVSSVITKGEVPPCILCIHRGQTQTLGNEPGENNSWDDEIGKGVVLFRTTPTKSCAKGLLCVGLLRLCMALVQNVESTSSKHITSPGQGVHIVYKRRNPPRWFGHKGLST